MALADRFATPTPSTTGSPCSIGAIIANLDDDDRATLLDKLGTPERRGLPAPVIYAALVADGHTPSLQQINRHRSGQCRCGK